MDSRTQDLVTRATTLFVALTDATDRVYTARRPELVKLAEVEAYRAAGRLDDFLAANPTAFYPCGGRERCPRCGLAMPRRGRPEGRNRCRCNPVVLPDPPKGRYGSLKGLATLFALVLGQQAQRLAWGR